MFDKGAGEMATVAALPRSREALLGPSAQRLEIGLLAARTAAVLRRIADGSDVDEVDRAVLGAASQMLKATADAVESIAAGGQLKRDPDSLGFGAMAFTVELTAPEVAAADLPKFFREMAQDVTKVQTESDIRAAERLLPAFSTLAEVATQQAGTVGEGGGTLF